ncbi:MAG: Crp/Fnr family transcriptional regulator [Pedobacter sp.]|nr:MAG: Crp/Fnr family transcriptional regulator [Pedobacter sp.]
MFSEINKNVCRYVNFHTEELEIFNALLKPKNYAKKAFLLRAGEVCNFEAFIVKGSLRKYCIDETGNEVIIQFGIENGWISDIASFSDQKPSLLFIETLEDTALLILDPKSKESLLSQVPKFERFYRKLVEKNISTMQNRLYYSIAKTAEQKYLDFLEHYPTIPQRVPQHFIASYLGMTPEFLSKVRARLLKK